MDRALPPHRFLSGLAGSVLAAALVLSPGIARADEPLPPQADTNPSRVPPPSAPVNLVLVGAGVAVFWYGAAVGTSYLWPDADGAASLRIPVAGPYMALAKTGCSSAEPDCTTLTVVVRTLFTGLSAIGQTGGVLAALEGVFVPSRGRPRAPSGRAEPAAHVAVAPAALGPGGLGLGLLGTF